MGIYVFDVDAITERLSEDAKDPDSAHDFGYSIIPRMVKHDRAICLSVRWLLARHRHYGAYYEANMELACQQPAFSS